MTVVGNYRVEKGTEQIMQLYKTQNIYFDMFMDQVRARSSDHICELIERNIAKDPDISLGQGIIQRALKKEQGKHGFSAMNNVLICHAKIKNLKHRKTIFMRLTQTVSVEAGGEQPVQFVACTLSPDRLGALNLRYLARLTRIFGNRELTEDLKSVDTVDGMRLLLNGENALTEVAA